MGGNFVSEVVHEIFLVGNFFLDLAVVIAKNICHALEELLVKKKLGTVVKCSFCENKCSLSQYNMVMLHNRALYSLTLHFLSDGK